MFGSPSRSSCLFTQQPKCFPSAKNDLPRRMTFVTVETCRTCWNQRETSCELAAEVATQAWLLLMVSSTAYGFT